MEDAEDLQAMAAVMQDDDDTDETETPSTKAQHAERDANADELAPAGAQADVHGFVSDVTISPETCSCAVILASSFSEPKLSMLGIAERVAATSNLRSRKEIHKCYVLKGRESEPFKIQTDGVSFETAWEFSDVIDINNVTSNDIAAVLNTYGVEAARATIINECKGVFGAYGITVDVRHLGLIADYMTHLVCPVCCLLGLYL